MKRILVTGASGFVGQKLNHTLREQGYTVLESDRMPDPGGSEYKACDNCDAESVAVEIVVDPDRIRPTDIKEVRGDHGAFTWQTGWVSKTSIE